VSRGEHPIEIPFLSMCEPACLYWLLWWHPWSVYSDLQLL
jgi:hypothetical protein